MEPSCVGPHPLRSALLAASFLICSCGADTPTHTRFQNTDAIFLRWNAARTSAARRPPAPLPVFLHPHTRHTTERRAASQGTPSAAAGDAIRGLTPFLLLTGLLVVWSRSKAALKNGPTYRALWPGARPALRPGMMLHAAATDDISVRSPVKPGPTRLPNLASAPQPLVDGRYDLVVLGAGPGGEAAAVLAAQLGARVLVIERRKQFGGPTGLTSKAVRQATKQIGATCDSLGGDRRRMLKKLWAKSFAILKADAEVSQAAETRGRLAKNGVQLLMSDSATLRPDGPAVVVRRGRKETVVQAKNVVIATGSRPARPAAIPFTPNLIVDATEIANVLCKGLPQSIGIIGGGVIAVEYATVLASVGVGVTVFAPTEQFMPALSAVLRQELMGILKQNRILVVHDPVDGVEPGDPEDLRSIISCGTRRFRVDLVLHSGGRDANSDGLGLEEAGVRIEKYGRIAVDAGFQTTVPHVYAIGDVVGGGLASAASKAGREVARQLFETTAAEDDDDELFGTRQRGISDVPVTLWTMPEMASVGATLEALRARGLLPIEEGGPVVAGIVRYSDLAQGRLVGGQGFVQVVARHVVGTVKGTTRSSHRIVGVHILGAGANDLIQLAALLVHTRCSLEMVANTPWAAVTLSQLLQHAADDALCRSPYSGLAKGG